MTNADVPSYALTVTNSSISWSGGALCYYTSGASPIIVNLDSAPRGCVLTLMSTNYGTDITLNRTSSTFYVSGWSETPTSLTLVGQGSVQFIISPDFARVYVLKYQG